MNVKNIKITQLEVNDGQIEGLPKNPRFIRDKRFEQLVKSIEDAPEMLEYRTLLVYPFGGKYVVVCGNMRLRACQQIGFKELPCYVLPEGTSVAKLREYAIKDNVAFGTDDFDLLANEWDSFELGNWGVELPNMDFDDLGESDEPADVEDVEIPDNVKTRCQKGDVWQLGEHRLMCGDSTDSGAVALLMNGEKADISFFSPPYNAGFGANITKDNGRSKYTNGDDNNKTQDEYASFLQDTIDNANNNSKFTFCNIQMLANNKSALFAALTKHFARLADIIIWDKGRSQPQLAANVLNSEFEFVFVFSDKANRNIGTVPFHGTLKNIVHISPSHNEYAKEHNAVFPIELAAHFIQNFAKDSVLDLFGGTGTTMIAAEQLNRKCFMMELDAHYCDVILARWEKLTGKTAKKMTE